MTGARGIGAAIALAFVAIAAHADPMRADRVAGPRAPMLPRPPPPPPAPAPEIAKVGKPIAGTWTCTGAVTKLDIEVGLNDAWITWRITGGAGTTLSFRTFDKVAKQWTMLELTSATAHHEASSLGPDAKGTWTWAIDETHRENEVLAPKAITLRGERRHGTSWATSYEATCTR